ncbi:MAG: SAM-dependent chlorinase/fluorinase [Bacteroidetes bacterium]|nr:SAM-dependent chlorinase/fluorinase [Bacteroidota bacterium]
MPLITLTSDLGTKDHYVALVKAALLSQIEESSVIDVSHHILKYNISNAAYVFDSVYKCFPKDTFHLVGVTAKNIQNRLLYVELNQQKIICLDNGFITLLKNHEEARVFYFNEQEFTPSLFFMGDTMVKALQALLKNATQPSPCTDYIQLMALQPIYMSDFVRGSCIHIDSFGNVVFNITKDFFESARKGRKFTISMPQAGNPITKISTAYREGGEEKAIALFNSSGHLEIAINQEFANKRLFQRDLKPVSYSNNSNDFYTPQSNFSLSIHFYD